MQTVKISLALLFTFITYLISAQNGFITGTVIDDATSETIPSVKVTVIENDKKALTDFDGVFKLAVSPGTYSIKFEFTSMDAIVINEIIVKTGETTVVEDIRLKEEVNEFEEVVTITAERIKSTENAVMSMKMKSTNMIDGISSDAFKKIGDSDAASAMKRVPGVSIVGGKYIYVRGLGDRYNKTTLNGVDIPGLDPDRNTLQMDIFPTSVIDNIIVNKSFVAELPADFAGGVVDIALKSLPSKRIRNVSIDGSYNNLYHFNSNYLSYDGSSTDFLGFDDGQRSIPATNNIPFFAEIIGNPNSEKASRYKQILGDFNPTMAAMQQKSGMDFGVSSTLGNQFTKGKYTMGYNFILSYKNTTEFYKDAIFGRYGLEADPSINEMEVRELQVGEYGVNSVLISSMAGFALKTLNSKYFINLIHLQNGESKAGIFDYDNSDQGAVFSGFQHNLEYTQKSLTNLLISGNHSIYNSKWDIEWKISPTLSKIVDPDIRFTRYEIRDNNYILSTEAGFPERIWRDLEEKNISALTHVTRAYKIFKRDAKLKFGAGYTYKVRDYSINQFLVNVRNLTLTGDPNEVFAESNLWGNTGNITSGTTIEPNFIPVNPNKFNSNISNISSYIATEFNPTIRLKTIIGVRGEYYTQRYTGQDQLGTKILKNDKVLENLGIFPSMNFIYSITEKQNLRLSYGKTIARPSFKELSYAEIADPLSGRTFIGGLFRDANDVDGIVYWDGNLTSSDIHNFDLRWEIFPRLGQTISFSTFYKKFIRPIEVVQFATQAGAFQPRNVGDGEVLGGEIEIRQNLELISSKLKTLTFTLNYTFTQSKIELSKTEYDSRIENARTGQTVNTFRDMAGQSPYIINSGLAYKGLAEKGLYKGVEIGIYYNVQGLTLLYAGMVDRPDIYTKEFHSLNLNATKTFGKKDQMQLGVKITNILNDKQEAVFKSYEAEEQYFTKLTIGQNYSLKFTYNF
jgi:TonB-dependent receptor